MSTQKQLPRLSEVFRKGMADHDQNLPIAFMLVLDELDNRQGLIEADIAENTRLFEVMIETLKSVSLSQAKMPDQLRSSTQNALDATLPDLKHHLRDAAKTGAAPTTRAIDTLAKASEDYQNHQSKLTTLAAFGLPIAFGATVVLGLLFGSFGIRHLPASWEWTCKIIGATHFTQNNGNTYCVIEK